MKNILHELMRKREIFRYAFRLCLISCTSGGFLRRIIDCTVGVICDLLYNKQKKQYRINTNNLCKIYGSVG